MNKNTARGRGKRPALNRRRLVRLGLDSALLVLMLVSFAYNLTGGPLHEVIGGLMFILALEHSRRIRHGAFFRPPVTRLRLLNATVNLLLAVAAAVLLISGLLISQTIFPFISSGDGFLLRRLHTLAAFWLLILAAIHLGLHWALISAMARPCSWWGRAGFLRAPALSLAALTVAALGVKMSFDRDIGDKLFMRSSFDYWNFEQSTAGFFLAYLAIMGLYVVVTHYFLKISRAFKGRNYVNSSRSGGLRGGGAAGGRSCFGRRRKKFRG